jgi:hypothetical protein
MDVGLGRKVVSEGSAIENRTQMHGKFDGLILPHMIYVCIYIYTHTHIYDITYCILE